MTKDRGIFTPENIGKKFRNSRYKDLIYTLLYVSPLGWVVSEHKGVENFWCPDYSLYELVPETVSRYILWSKLPTGVVVTNVCSDLGTAEELKHGLPEIYEHLGITTTTIELP